MSSQSPWMIRAQRKVIRSYSFTRAYIYMVKITNFSSKGTVKQVKTQSHQAEKNCLHIIEMD